MSFDEAYKIFSRKRYCQFNILANYALKFEGDKYEFIDICLDNDKFSVAQNGCPTTRDVLCGLVKSFKISKDNIKNNNIIIQKHKTELIGSCVDININYEDIINDTRHANNHAHFTFNQPCSLEQINEHYKNVYRDINNLTTNKKDELNNKVIYFLENDFNDIMIKCCWGDDVKVYDELSLMAVLASKIIPMDNLNDTGGKHEHTFNLNVFEYGTIHTKINITEKVNKKCLKENGIFIPSGDFNRSNLFGDPLYGILKSIFINGIEYKHYSKIFIDKSINTIYQIDEIPEHLKLLDK